MILGVDKVLELIKTQKLIEGLDEKDINFEGCGIDLRIGEIYEMVEDEGFLQLQLKRSTHLKIFLVGFYRDLLCTNAE